MQLFLKDKNLAVVIPVYNEAAALYENFKEIHKILLSDGIKPLYLLVDDGSSDDSWSVIQVLSREYEQVSAIKFARNFGKELALSAGLESVDADYYVFMDSDLQHPPSLIKTMIQTMQTTRCDIVEGIKSSRGVESFTHRFFAKYFYKLLRLVSNLNLDDSSDFKLMTRQVVDQIRRFNESNLFFRGIISWVGFETVQVPFEVAQRKRGTTHFSTLKLIGLAINAMLAYSSKPLYLTLISGGVFFVFSLLMGIQTLYNYMMGVAVDGFSTVILLILITGSLMLFSLGIIGVYLSRIYDEVKRRPRYVIQHSIDSTKKSIS
jgi:glycosyltransferase involved in cell wall biosynthesis